MAGEPQQPKFVIEPLGAKHDRAAFACGTPVLDSYLQKQAAQDLKKRVAVPYVITPDGHTVAGFYTLSQYGVKLVEVPEDLARKLPKYPMVPTTLLGRLAVDSRFRGRGLGEILLMDALRRSLETSRQLASAAVIVDAKDDAAAGFYRKYGFMELPAVPGRFFMPMGTVAKLFDN